ncbi:MAG TPA: UDP-N-acetylmuramoyl-tripeptide--D-alanyl-D-alanine ligase [Tepidisphaeraceae bacterium]|jgi:UDP-N-acetylmuramoyl-tripeptide--D-alanyl-D-alanine ligase|nr:UDP-N-acetylmuramoyl-tripeptide--D-alanyl-D-alanine ligase [Tepidisphaeraceae bacterium]
MKPQDIQQIRQAVAGRSMGAIPASFPSITAICTDTRKMQPGSLFIALRGENYDAHNFLNAAAADGAIAALVEEVPANSPPSLHLIQVANTRTAMGKLARSIRQQMQAKVVAVAGSNGKTSTKNLIHSALAGRLQGSISPKSYNNDIGVPLAIFPADPSEDYLVLELGTNHPGEIKVLTDIALPDIAVITNCGPEHLEFLGDLMGVRRENASIIHGLNPKGLLIINGDDPDLIEATAAYEGKRITFGFKSTNDLFATDVECNETGVRFRLNNGRKQVFVPLLGKHTAANALAAIAVARRLGLSEDEIIDNLSRAAGTEMRLELTHTPTGITILNDAYNANPASMKAALETAITLRPSPHAGRLIAILGDMLELGEASDRFHREVGTFAAGCRFDLLACVGPHSAHIATAAESAGMDPARILLYPDSTAAAASLPSLIHPRDVTLLKASRGTRLELVAQSLSQTTPAQSRKAAS